MFDTGSQYGKLQDVRMATDDDGHARGYAFVEYENPVSPLEPI